MEIDIGVTSWAKSLGEQSSDLNLFEDNLLESSQNYCRQGYKV